MADHNRTLSRTIDGKVIIGECMMHVKNMLNPLDIIIPLTWLNKGITVEDVYKWVEIGNTTLFPAKIKEEKISRKVINISDHLIYPKIYGVAVEPRVLTNKEDCYISSWAASNIRLRKNVVLSKIAVPFSSIKRDLGGNNCVLKDNVSGWEASAYINDLKVVGSSELLKSYIVRKYEEISNEIEPDFHDCIVITIDNRSAISAIHKLAILTFYRYLWSNRYKNVVTDTLRVMSLGFSGWESLYAALCKNGEAYTDYYSLISYKGYKPMEAVKNSLRSTSYVNTAFSVKKGTDNRVVFHENNNILKENVKSFIDKQQQYVDPENMRVQCIDDGGCASLYADGIYLCEEYCYENFEKLNNIIKVKGADYTWRWYSKYRFKKL